MTVIIDGTIGITAPTIAATTNITAPTITTVDLSTKVPGEIFKFAGAVAPVGALLCPTAPTLVSTATYPALFAAIGYAWGGSGVTFGLPYFPADYAPVQSNGNVGTGSVGQVLTHTHIYYYSRRTCRNRIYFWNCK